MKTEIPIGQTGEIDGIEVKAVAPENYIDLCHGCRFVDVHRNDTCILDKPICRFPDRIFKQINN
jgi:hypothetical protein